MTQRKKQDVPGGDDRLAIGDHKIQEMRAGLLGISEKLMAMQSAYNSSIFAKLVDEVDRLHHRIAQFNMGERACVRVFQLGKQKSARTTNTTLAFLPETERP